MKTRSVSLPTTSASSTSTCGSAAARRLSTSACKLLIHPPSDNKKAGERPLSNLRRRTAGLTKAVRQKIAPCTWAARSRRRWHSARFLAVLAVLADSRIEGKWAPVAERSGASRVHFALPTGAKCTLDLERRVDREIRGN